MTLPLDGFTLDMNQFQEAWHVWKGLKSRFIIGFNLPRLFNPYAGSGFGQLIQNDAKKPENWLKLWHIDTYLRELCKNCPMNTNMTGSGLDIGACPIALGK